jgi:hypothetical protein
LSKGKLEIENLGVVDYIIQKIFTGIIGGRLQVASGRLQLAPFRLSRRRKFFWVTIPAKQAVQE